MRPIEIDPHPLLVAGLIEARVTPGPSPAALQELLATTAAVPETFRLAPESRQKAQDHVRALLRHCGYRPAGRGKPASEFLAQTAQKEGRMHSINALVDVNNVASLHTALPMSIFDGERLGPRLRIAPGAPGESYVFNASGHAIDLEGLLTVYHRASSDEPWKPAGNAVKDSMPTKVHEGTTSVVVVIWSTTALGEAYTGQALDWFAELLESSAGGAAVEKVIAAAPRGS